MESNIPYKHSDKNSEGVNTSETLKKFTEGIQERTRELSSGQIVKSLLRERAKKQAQFAREIGITPQSFNNYISGKFGVPTQIKLLIAKGLGVDSSVIWDLK